MPTRIVTSNNIEIEAFRVADSEHSISVLVQLQCLLPKLELHTRDVKARRKN